jgi:transposase
MRIPSLYGNVRIVDLLVHSPRSNAVRILGATQVWASLPLTQRFNFSKIYLACYKRAPSAAQDCWAQIKPTRVRRSSQSVSSAQAESMHAL